MQENSMGGAMLSEGNKPRLYCYFALEREPKLALVEHIRTFFAKQSQEFTSPNFSQQNSV